MRVNFRVFGIGLVALLALVSRAGAWAAEGKRYEPTETAHFYMACYLVPTFESPAIAFPPVAANGDEMFHYFEGNLQRALKPQFAQQHTFSCVQDDTPELAIQARSAILLPHRAIEEQAWPAGLPDAARPIYISGRGTVPRGSIANEVFSVACFAYQPGPYTPGGVRSTWLPVVQATGAEYGDLRTKVEQSVRRSQPAAKVSCPAAGTDDEVAELRARDSFKASEAPWPAEIRLASLGSKAPPPPPKKPATPKGPAKPVVIPALTIKEDTGPQDAQKRWEEAQKKYLVNRARVEAETAAKALQQDAELKRKIEAIMAERRMRGAAQ